MGNSVEYFDGEGQRLEGYLALPSVGAGNGAAVLVVPEGPGLGPMPKRRADMLADLGYLAFAMDLYGEGKFVGYTNGEAETLAYAMLDNTALLLTRVKAGLNALRNVQGVDPARLFAIGYCLGGLGVLDLARSGEPLLGVVSFHGVLTTKFPPADGSVRASILACTGSKDPLAPPEHVAAFQSEMDAVNADFRVLILGGAGHAFTSTGIPKGSLPQAGPDFGFDEAADRGSWQALISFLKEFDRPASA